MSVEENLKKTKGDSQAVQNLIRKDLYAVSIIRLRGFTMALDVLLGNIPLQVEAFFFGVIGLLCVAIWVILFIVIAIWVYRDAESRGMSGALWLIIVILAGLIGLIIYLVVRSEKRQYPYPQQPYQQPPAYAPPAAQAPPPAQAPPATRFCSNCGAGLPPGASACPNCGTKVQ